MNEKFFNRKLLLDIKKGIKFLRDPILYDKAVRNCNEVFRSGLEIVVRLEYFLTFAFRAVN